MKWKIVVLLMLFLAPAVLALDTCEDITTVPCVAVTPNISCSANYTIYNESNVRIFSGNMTLVNDSFYNFTINLSQGTYSIELCSGHTASITIKDLLDPEAGFYTMAVVIIAGLFFYLAINFKNKHAVLQFFFLMMGIYMIIITFHLMYAVGDVENLSGIQELANGMYWVAILVAFVLVLYYILMLIYTVLTNMRKRIR